MISPFIVGPVVGSVIGYITNALAIRMLFRPYNAKYIFGVKVPFTPGIIPKEKGRIAKSLGTAISNNLMNQDVLQASLLSPEMVEKIRTAIESFFEQQRHNPETLREYLLHYMSESEISAAIESLKDNFSREVATRLDDTTLGDRVADIVVQQVTGSLRINGLNIEAPGFVKNVLNAGIWGKIADMIQAPARKFLAKNINNILQNHGQEIVMGLVGGEIDRLESTPVQTLLAGREKEINQLCDTMISLYKKLITEQLPKILEAIDIPQIIENRINGMDMAETEKIIFEVMNKELRAIIWLGAGLGFLMGFVNALI